MTKECTIEVDGQDMFVIFEGKRIAKRGHKGTPQAGTWISLEPGYTVHSTADHSQITVVKDGVVLR